MGLPSDNPCVGLWLQGVLEVGGALFTGALAALLGVGLDISLESSHVGRSERVADWKG